VDLQLDARVAIITGGSKGIGLGTARSLAREGMRIVLAARDPMTLEEAAQTLRAEGHMDVLPIVTDTTDDDSVARMVVQVLDEYGRVDVVVNAAARAAAGPAASVIDFRPSDLAQEIDTKLVGYVRVIRAVLPHMIERGSGRIVNIAGIAAILSGNVVGAIRNSAIVVMTKALSDELRGTGVGVVAVHPGLTLTDAVIAMIEQRAQREQRSVEEIERELAGTSSTGRLMTVEDVARVVTFLASPLAEPTNGEVITVNGGVRSLIRH
jgi:NAD(P)-dependent dehydrogenase (short-subunit alcohol dehydrogenase family)